MLIVPAEAFVQQADPGVRYEEAVADRIAGRPEVAEPKLRQVLAQRPDDVDARLNLGLSLLALGRLAEAEAEFERVLVVAPDYADARLGLARARQRRGDVEGARQAAGDLLRRSPDNIEARALADSLAPRPWRLDVDATYSDLSAGLDPWRETRIGLTRRVDSRWTVGAAIEHTERFGDRDTFLEARLDHAWSSGGGYVALGGTPDADYRPEVSLRFGVSQAVAPRLALSADASIAQFRSGTVSSLQSGMTWRAVPERLALTARWINVWDERDERSGGFAVQGDLTLTDRLRTRLVYADAPETSEGVVTDVRGWSAGAEYDLNARISVRGALLFEDRGAYDRTGGGLGLAWRF